MAVHPITDWNSGLFDCCDDVGSCCYGFWCCCCLSCTVAGTVGENRCLPLCDICSPAFLTCVGIPLFAPPAGISIRVGIRHKYGIKGSYCEDVATSCFCVWCNWCQMHRELKFRKKSGATVVNMQPVPVNSPYDNAPPPPGFRGQPAIVVASY